MEKVYAALKYGWRKYEISIDDQESMQFAIDDNKKQLTYDCYVNLLRLSHDRKFRT